MAAMENPQSAVEKSLLLIETVEDGEKSVDYELVKELLQEGVNPLENSASVLFTAVERDDEHLLQVLLTHSQAGGELYGSRDLNGLSLLQLASKFGYLECVSLLLSIGFKLPIHINARCTVGGNTALMYACVKDHTAVCKLLLEAGASPNVANHRGAYPVHVATSHGCLALLQELRASGADMSVRNRHGESVLHLSRHPFVTEYLHECGASVLQRNRAGKTALECAQQRDADNQNVATLRRLELREQRHSEIQHCGRISKTVHRLKWFISDTLNEIGWKVFAVVVVVTGLVAWQLTVYIHGVNPLYTKTI